MNQDFHDSLPSQAHVADRCPVCDYLLTRRRFVRLAAVATTGLALTGVYGRALAEEPVHWSYEGEAGPANWGQLSPDYAACAAGTEQSPVDIPAGAPVNPSGVVFAYQPTALNIVNNGHTIQVNYDSGSVIQLEGQTYGLVQFHFHTPSEHTLAGEHADMELHLVHKDAAGNLAVVGVMLDQGQENAAYAPIWAHLPAEEGDPETVGDVTVNADALLPADRSYYRYNGSLTTPPCSEGVKWLVMRTPVELSAAQVATFQAIISENARPVQVLNGRTFIAAPQALPVSGGD